MASRKDCSTRSPQNRTSREDVEDSSTSILQSAEGYEHDGMAPMRPTRARDEKFEGDLRARPSPARRILDTRKEIARHRYYR